MSKKLKKKSAINIRHKKKKELLAMYLKKGLSLKESCVLAKVSPMMLASLRSDVEFDEFVQEMGLYFEANLLDDISTAGKSGYWQASAWLLERKLPEKYGKKDIVKHEYEIKLMTFQKAVLDVVNKVDPNIKLQIVQQLKQINTEHENDDIVEAELIEN